jgi:hypothetical protein
MLYTLLQSQIYSQLFCYSMLKRWMQYFESLFERASAPEVSEASNEKEDENDCKIRMEEIVKALKGMKAGKTTVYDSVWRNATSRARYCSMPAVPPFQFVLDEWLSTERLMFGGYRPSIQG